MKKKIAILGSTGSIGRQTLEVVDRFPESLEVVALSAGSNVALLQEQINKYKPSLVCIGDSRLADKLAAELQGQQIKVVSGSEGLIQVATHPEATVVVTSVTGTVGLLPTVEAIKAGKNIALANKETLVAAGELVIDLARKYQVKILPVDSEHSAIFQCLQGQPKKALEKILLTASGGPFRGYSQEKLAAVTPEMALKHPNWSMGAKITIDSATLINKGLEVIEAKWLYGVDYEQIQVVVHPQSVIHSMVQFQDGSVIAQLGLPDMRLPIQYALSYPERWTNDFPKIDFWQMGDLSFMPPDTKVFSGLSLAYHAGKIGGTMPAVMNAANEKAVELFLKKKIGFADIPQLVEKTMQSHAVKSNPDLDEILIADSWARKEVIKSVGQRMV